MAPRASVGQQVGWDGLVEDLADDEGHVDHNEDDVFVQNLL